MRPETAKYAAPRAMGAVPRKRLWRRLDSVRRRGGAVWVAGAPGSGKTTLVAGWVAARRERAIWMRVDRGDVDLPTFFHHLSAAAANAYRLRRRLPALGPGLDPELFARRFFRELFAPPRHGAVLVLDDLDEACEDPRFQLLLGALLEELPAGAMAVLACRREPSASLSHARAERRLEVLGPDDLRFTPVEARALALRHSFRGTRTGVAEVLRSAHGWAAGLVVLLEGGRRGGPGSGAISEYFSEVVLARADAVARRVLLESALLDAPSATLVARTTGLPDAPRILDRFARRGIFTLRRDREDPSYEFHPLFRGFLLERGRSELPPGRAAQVLRAAAEVLATRGQVASEEAVRALLEAGDHDGAARLIGREAPAMLAQGRLATLAGWIDRLPAPARDRDPWLLLHEGMTRLPGDPDSALDRFRLAGSRLAERGDAAGAWLSWSAAAEAIFLAGRDFSPFTAHVEELAALRARLPRPPDALAARAAIATLTALVHHAPGHPELEAAAGAAREIALRPGADDRERLLAGAWYHVHAAWWMGDLEAVRPVVEALGAVARSPAADPLAAVLWLAAEAPYHLLRDDPGAAARTAGEAADVARRHGIRAMDALLVTQAIWGALARDDVPAAEAALATLTTSLRPGCPTDAAVAKAFRALVRLRAGRHDEACRLAREAKALGERLGHATVHVMADVVLAVAMSRAAGEAADEVDGAFSAAHRKIDPLGSPPFAHLMALADAERARREGRSEDAVRALERALLTARAGALHARYLFSREQLGRLWALALRRGLAREAARAYIRGHDLPPPGDAGSEWPWPLRIRALGTLEIERDGSPVVRPPRRPLDLLRLLIALGGRDVPEARLTDALWPDADADAAQHALETTLYRLRRVVGPGVVVQRERRLSIAADRCWVDARALETLLAEELASAARGARGAATGRSRDEAAERVLELYRAPLLADAGDAPWAVAARDQLRRRLLRWLDTLGGGPGGEGERLRARLAAADGLLDARPALRLA